MSCAPRAIHRAVFTPPRCSTHSSDPFLCPAQCSAQQLLGLLLPLLVLLLLLPGHLLPKPEFFPSFSPDLDEWPISRCQSSPFSEQRMMDGAGAAEEQVLCPGCCWAPHQGLAGARVPCRNPDPTRLLRNQVGL